MKRLIFSGLALLAVVTLAMWGNRILERTLDAELPSLLSRELGIPVTLAPTQARIATLTVYTPRLIMGDPADPALSATRVSVALDWSDLLHGEIRLRRASGEELMVKPSLWPTNDDPWPTDYRFLDPYLPDYIALAKARYVTAQGDSHTFTAPSWRRQSPGARLAWQEDLEGQAMDIGVELTSLDQLLRLAGMQLHVTSTATGRDDSTLAFSLDLQPGAQSGYSLTASINGAGMTVQVSTGNSKSWELPDQSTTTIKQLDIEKLAALLRSYRADAKDASAEEVLALPLPRLSLPPHRGRVTIDEIRWQDEVGTDSVIDFVTGADGVTIPSLSSHGPEGVLQAQLAISSSDSGWQLELEADLETVEAGDSLAAPYMAADWFWREGSGKLAGQGATWGTLLNSLRGDLTLHGSYRGAVETPVSITAKLDNRPGELILDTIEVTLARGRITGSARLSGEERKHLGGTLRAEQVNLDLLLPAAEPGTAPGIALPTYLQALPGVDLDWELEVSELSVKQFDIASANIRFARTANLGNLTASISGTRDEKLDLTLQAARQSPGQAPDVTLRADLSNLSLAEVFGQAALLPDSRTSGTINVHAKGNTMAQVFEAMEGRAELTIDRRPDQDWKRPPEPAEQLQVAGNARLVLADQRITGLLITGLAIDSTLQNLTGNLSFVQGRKPWLEADLTSEKLDLADLQSLQKGDADTASSTDSLDTLRSLGDSRLTLKAKSLSVAQALLHDVVLLVATAPDDIQIEQLDFSMAQGRLSSAGGLSWRKDEASLSLEARVENFSLDQFLTDTPAMANAPLSGTVSLHSKGSTTSSLLANLSGDIKLETPPDAGSAPAASGRIDMTAQQTGQGMRADIRRFQWAGTELAGTVQYHATTPPLLEVAINGGSLSLLPWEADKSRAEDDAATKPDGSIVTRTAKAGVGLIGDVIMAPLRLISGPREAEPGEKLFSTAPLPLDWLKIYPGEVRVSGKLGSVTSREATAGDLEFSANLRAGQLAVEASAASLNGGSVSGKLKLDAAQSPATVAMSGTFMNMRGDLIKAGFPRSGYFDVTSGGNSQAELAGNVNGLIYLDLGAGPLDYTKLMLLTADAATAVFETLIPGSDKKPPTLECGVTLGIFKDGIGTTPYGYAVRTDIANLAGQVEIDLKKELLHASFSSSSRRGIGISVGNVFSNTVEVEGPLTNPKIIPNATSLLWRSWAAVVTGGLSVVGESVLKRALASENPCTSVKKHIHKKFCTTDAAATASTMVCPTD